MSRKLVRLTVEIFYINTMNAEYLFAGDFACGRDVKFPDAVACGVGGQHCRLK